MRTLLVVLLLCASYGQSEQHAPQSPDLVDPIIIVSSAYYMDGGTQAFFLTDGAGKKRAISVDGRMFSETQGRIYLGGHPDHGRLTTKDEERAYIDILKRAVEVYTPAQLAAMEEAVDKHALDDPHPVKEIAYVTAKEFLIQRLGPSYQNYLKNHPSHKEAAKARESDEQSAFKQAIKEQSDRAIIRFVQKYPDSSSCPMQFNICRNFNTTKSKNAVYSRIQCCPDFEIEEKDRVV